MADERVVSVYHENGNFKVYDHLQDKETVFKSVAEAGKCAKTVIKNWPRSVKRRKRKRKNVVKFGELSFADWRMAKKRYTCRGCGTAIQAGQYYWRAYGKLEYTGQFVDYCYCQICGGTIISGD